LSAGKDGELWPTFWLEKKIAIGWSALGDLRTFSSRDALLQEYRKTWSNEKPRAEQTAINQIWNFYRGIKRDDVVFIRSYGALLGIALVVGDYDFIDTNAPLRDKFYSPYFEDYFPHVRPIRWISLGGGMKQPLTLTRLTVL
jgi:predicted Mrr-cat superfamily restriction endonuclease